MNRIRTVITGMGIVSPIGCSVSEFWNNLIEGKYGIRPITVFDPAGFPYKQAGEVIDFQPEINAGIEPVDRGLAFILEAVRQALVDAKLYPETSTIIPAGIMLSTNFGSAIAMENVLKGTASSHDFLKSGFQYSADIVARIFKLSGPRIVQSLSCSGGTSAIGLAAGLIRSGRVDIAIAGGYDELSTFAWSGLSALRTMTTDKIKPFDKNRAGTIFSEGAGALVIENIEHARKRHVRCYAEVAGYAMNNNAFHLTAPPRDGTGSARVMQEALLDAGLSPDSVDHINAHGTGTRDNDVTETRAIKTVFGEYASKIPVTSNKSIIGHMMGAAGTAEAIASVLTIKNGIIPPTINYETPDPECDLDYVPNVKRKASIKVVLSNSAGIGGCNAAIVLRTIEETNE